MNLSGLQVLYVTFSLVLLGSCTAAGWEHTIYIDPAKGHDDQGCVSGVSSSSKVPCKTLNYAFRHEYRRNSTQYLLYPGTHRLDNSTYSSPFSSPLEGLAIVGTGNSSSDTIIECNAPNASLAFLGVSDIHLEKVIFFKCAGLRNSTSRHYSSPTFSVYTFQAALYFYHCKDVEMTSIGVTDSPNATGVVMYNTVGSNRVISSEFARNSVIFPHVGGGGFYVEFTYCIPGDNNCSYTHSVVSANSNSYYLFQNCTFNNNYANDSKHDPYILPNKRNHTMFGRGGGLALFFKGNASNNTFNISCCQFKDNQALWGGGLCTEFQDTTVGNSVRVKDTIFQNNRCLNTSTVGNGGGGMRVSQYTYSEGTQNVRGNHIILQKSRFINNSALNGGGLSIVPILQNANFVQTASITVDACHFEQNIAKLGAAVYVSRFLAAGKGEIMTVTFSNSTFISNTVVHFKHPPIHQAGIGGALYVNAVPVEFSKYVCFEFNSGSALCLIETYADFTDCRATFVENSGYKGGAIALLGAASIVVDNFTVMRFENNTAALQGAAIYNKYIERENFNANCFIHHKNPFLQPDDWNARFYFYNNTANSSCNPIYSTSILPCARAAFGNKSAILHWNNWIYESNCEIRTDVGKIAGNTTVNAIPGKIFILPLSIQDDLGHDITNLAVFSATSGNVSVACVDPGFTYVSGEEVKVSGRENSTFTLRLHNSGERVWHVDMNVNLQICPPGLKQSSNNSASVCVCAGNYSGIVKCQKGSFQSSLKRDNWMGYWPSETDHPNVLVVASCPSRYCNAKQAMPFLPLPSSPSQLDEHICGQKHRTGILCGECQDGYGPAVNRKSFDCVPCNSTNIAANATFYALSTYLPLFLFFTVIIFFNIKLSTGPANAFILYSQVISSTFDLQADGHIPLFMFTNHTLDLLRGYRVLYGLFNLDFVETLVWPLCLGTDLNVLDILGIHYVVAFFPLLLVIAVFVIVRLKWHCCICCQPCRKQNVCENVCKLCRWKAGGALPHTIAAFILLSYTRISLVSSYIVKICPLMDENGNQVGSQRVYFAGQFAVNDPRYLKYLLPACFIFFTFIAIPPLLLLQFPLKLLECCINRVKCLRRWYPQANVQFLLDTFQGCFENNMRFFAGLYFLFRLAINISYIFSENWMQHFFNQQIMCAIMIVLLALCQPYKKKFFNYVDILMFTNLALLNAFSFYLYTFAHIFPAQPLPIILFAIQYVLIFLPLFYMIGYLMWYCSKRWHEQLNQNCLQPLLKCCLSVEKRNDQNLVNAASFKSGMSVDVCVDESEDEALLRRAEARNLYRPSMPQISTTKQSNFEQMTGHNCITTSSGYVTGNDQQTTGQSAEIKQSRHSFATSPCDHQTSGQSANFEQSGYNYITAPSDHQTSGQSANFEQSGYNYITAPSDHQTSGQSTNFKQSGYNYITAPSNHQTSGQSANFEQSGYIYATAPSDFQATGQNAEL